MSETRRVIGVIAFVIGTLLTGCGVTLVPNDKQSILGGFCLLIGGWIVGITAHWRWP